VAVELLHERLAESHDLVVRFALRVKVCASLSASEWQTGECIFKNLFKSQKFEDAKVYGRVEPESAFVGADGRVHLYAVAAVYVDLSVVVGPAHPEGDHPLRLNHPLQYFQRVVFP